MDQPGERWRYTTGATVAGILIERVTGAPLAEVLSHRVFGPLGMTDTGFYVPAAKQHRFTSSVALMLRNRTTAQDRAENPWFFGEHLGWGLMMSVPAAGVDPQAVPDGTPRGYGWEGGSGTAWRNASTRRMSGPWAR